MENDDGDEREGTAITASKQGGRGEGGTSSNSNGNSNSKTRKVANANPPTLSFWLFVCLSVCLCVSVSLSLVISCLLSSEVRARGVRKRRQPSMCCPCHSLTHDQGLALIS